jgi:N-acetylglucosamine-6-phosphate deacetylase
VSTLLAADLALGGLVAPGWAEVDSGVLAAIGHGEPPRAADQHVDGVLAPGLFDLQVNGAAGFEVTGGPEALDAIDALLLARGVTSYLPTLVSPADATALTALEQLAARAADPLSPVAGVHLEGPFLSREHAGMHPVERLRAPADGVPDWLEHPAVRLVTLAPELPGALELIDRLVARGITVSLGHSGAGADVARAAIDAGARMVTHVFNAMAPLHHRAPGLAGAALVDDRVRVGVIPDGRHVDPVVLELVRRSAGPRVVLVTDATPAAGVAPGHFTMAGVAIERHSDGAARTLDGRLAGGALTLDEGVRSWDSVTGATLAEAIFAASEAPGLAVGCAAAVPGAPADLVALSETGEVRRVMRAGRWLEPMSPG